MARHPRQYPTVLICILTVFLLVLLAATLVACRQAKQTHDALAAARLEISNLRQQLADAEAALAVPPAPPTEETVPPTTAPETLPEETLPPDEAQPEALSALLQREEITYDALREQQCTQLITVEASGNAAQIRFFTCTEDLWSESTDLACPGFVGRNGATSGKREGDGCTPTGLYGVGSGFYIKNAPQTGLDLFQITRDTYWVDDPNSKFYNQRVEGTENKDWKSAEHMIAYSEYLYGFVVDYNVTAEKGAGSAIFFHINDNPTAGCIATGEKMVLAYMAQLDKYQNPKILIAK